MKDLFIFFLISFYSCTNNDISYPNPPGYNLQKPIVVSLPLELDEISGISYYPKDKSVFAIDDEKGVLYKITPFPELKIKKWKFSKKADFEDVILLDSTFYVLQSNGTIYMLNFLNKDNITTSEFAFSNKNKNEFEAFFYDPSSKNLEVICKNCEDEKKKMIKAYMFDLVNTGYNDSALSIDVSSIFKKLNEKPFHIKASAAAVHPVTGEIYILASVNNLLLILNKDQSLKSYYKLNPGMFKQPEGITFSDNGTLIISNESAESGSANLLVFTYNKTATQ